MDCESTTGPESIYFRCRKTAAVHNDKLNSREGAAEMLGLSSSQLAKYELGVTKTIPPDAIVGMANLYNAPELKTLYCSNVCPIGKHEPIATKVDTLSFAAVKMVKAFSPATIESAKKNDRHSCLRNSDKGRIGRHRILAWLTSRLGKKHQRIKTMLPKDFGRKERSLVCVNTA